MLITAWNKLHHIVFHASTDKKLRQDFQNPKSICLMEMKIKS